MGNKLYLVAGSRNIALAESAKSGLWANVGMTQGRPPEERLRDPDYRKKQIGGELLVLTQWDIGKSTDHEIHPDLKRHDEVRYEKSDNTEEFLFLTDSGDGIRAQQIIEEIVAKRCAPAFVSQRLESQTGVITQLTKQLEKERNLRLKVETSEPWQIMQEQLLEIETNLNVTSQEKIDKVARKYAEVMADSSDQIRALTDNNKDLEAERIRLETDNALLVKQIEASDRSNAEHSRYSLLMTLFATTLAAGVSFDLIGSHYDASVSDKMTTISELEYELKETKRDHWLEKSRAGSLERQLKQIEAGKKRKEEKALQTKKVAAAKRKKNADKVCKAATTCVIDSSSDNIVHCSVYSGGQRYRCSVILNERFYHGQWYEDGYDSSVHNEGVMDFTGGLNKAPWTEFLYVNSGYRNAHEYIIEKRGSRY